MKRIVVHWKDEESETIILGTCREVKSLHNNLRKRFWYLYNHEPFARPMTDADRAKMYGISLYDFGIMTADTVAHIIATEKVEFPTSFQI